MTDRITQCDVVNCCEDCPRYADDCDGDKYLDRYPTMHEYAEGKRINPKLSDRISRADAIEEISKGVWNVHELIDRINALPSAELPKGDLISRRWLLDLYGDYIGDNGDTKYHVPLEVVRQNIIDAPSAEAEWIPCSERLPNEDECGWYLVTVKGHELFVDVAPFNDELWKGLASHQEVIAWMPLPKPYREDGEV